MTKEQYRIMLAGMLVFGPLAYFLLNRKIAALTADVAQVKSVSMGIKG
jgi:hypothetical protein